MAVLDSADALTVLNFRQFLLEMTGAANIAQGLNTNTANGALRAQYIGSPVPIRNGNVGGACRVTGGVGRVVLH